jgi:hypothetical protein
MGSIGAIELLLVFAVWAAAVVGFVFLVLAIVRISQALQRISRSLEELAAAKRSEMANPIAK